MIDTDRKETYDIIQAPIYINPFLPEGCQHHPSILSTDAVEVPPTCFMLKIPASVVSCDTNPILFPSTFKK